MPAPESPRAAGVATYNGRRCARQAPNSGASARTRTLVRLSLPMRILLVASEVTPFAKTGGLADVSAALTRYLTAAGHDVRLVMPLYRRVQRGDHGLVPHETLRDIPLELGDTTYRFSFSTGVLPPPPGLSSKKEPVEDAPVVWFLDCPELYDQDELYGDGPLEHQRFALLSRAPLAMCQFEAWAPDIVHCNDWHTGLLPLYLKTRYAWDRIFAETRSVLTIHNIGYQGLFPASTLEGLDLDAERHLLDQDDLENDQINFLKTGLVYADALTTVSETYAREIQTPEYGMGLQDVLRARSDALTGIVNGVDYGEWDPRTDARIPHTYTPEDLAGKVACKRELLAKFDLEEDERAPLLGVVSRLTGQKGFELLPDVLPVLLQSHGARLVVLGSGENTYESYFQWLRDTYPKRVGVYRGYSEDLAHWIEAASDLFLMPSRYEPCGLNQMYSLRYGTIPVVRATGGLADTVRDFDPRSGQGTGFRFEEFSAQALFDALRRALQVYAEPEAWARLVQNAMAEDWSWQRQGRHYVDLYERLAAR